MKIKLSTEIFPQALVKNFVVRSNLRKQCHGRLKLHIIRVAEDLFD